MTTDAPNHVTAEVDQAAPKRTKDGIRFTVTLSFPFKAHKPLAMFLMEQLANPLDVDFTMIQPSLESVTASMAKNGPTITGPAQDIRYAEHKTTVDGVEALVMLPVTDGGRRNSYKPHPYKADPENASKCLWCQKAERYQSHDPSRIEAAAQEQIAKVKANGAASNGHKSTPDEKAAAGEELLQRMQAAAQTAHAFEPREQDDRCDACGHGADETMHAEQLPEHMRKTADALIAQAEATEAVPSA